MGTIILYAYICEGTAEQDIIEWLLEEDRLLFNKDSLVDKRITRIRKAKKIEKEFLSLDYDKPVVIFRIIDSRNEKFTLGNLYKDRFTVRNLITNPEIEILMIIDKDDYQNYTKKWESKVKPSEYASTQYKIKKIKQQGTIKDFFNSDIDSLISAIKSHKKMKGKKHLTINDILK